MFKIQYIDPYLILHTQVKKKIVKLLEKERVFVWSWDNKKSFLNIKKAKS